MDDLTKRDVAITAVGIIIAAVLVSILAWCLVRVFALSDPRDLLTRAGELKPTQDLRRAK
jgi:hypothetical protein